MSRTRWVEDAAPPAAATGHAGPPIPNLEVTYLTDPDVVAEVLPRPLETPPEPRVHVRVCDIDIRHGDFVHRERVGWFGVDAMWEGRAGEYPLLIPIDLEPALAISREKYGEPKKLADIELTRDGDHVRGSITRQGVTFVEIVGDIAEKLPTPAPYETMQFWFKFLPAAVGSGLDAGPFLVTLEQVRTHESQERVDGKLELRDLPGCPVVDLPILETVSINWSVRSAQNTYRYHGAVGDADDFARRVAIQYK
jgi:acetoacetate decarboxylase